MELDSVLSNVKSSLIGLGRGLEVIATEDELGEAKLFHRGCSLLNCMFAIVFPLVFDVV